MLKSNENTALLLSGARIEVAPETYNVVSLSDVEWRTLLETPELSPRMTVPFMIFKDKWEVTLILDEDDFRTIRHTIRDGKVERGFRLMSFDVELEFDVVGFMAAITSILAAQGISILALSSFSRDHLLVRQEDLSEALKSMRGHVAEVC